MQICSMCSTPGLRITHLAPRGRGIGTSKLYDNDIFDRLTKRLEVMWDSLLLNSLLMITYNII